jgi:hypothetical protein
VPGLLGRCLGFVAAIVTLFGMVAYGAAHRGTPAEWCWAAFIPALLATTGFINFLLAEKRVLFTFLQHRRALSTGLRHLTFAGVPPGAVPRFTDDPAIRKYTADLEHAGFVLHGDVAIVPLREARMVYRVFRAPDGVGYLILTCLHASGDDPDTRKRYWPAAVTWQAQTFFDGGGRVDSLNVSEFSYWNMPAARNTLIREVQVSDPIQFFEEHVVAAELFAIKRSLNTVRHVRFEEYLQLQQDIQDDDFDYFETHPYSLRDHLRWYLQLPRREYSGKR